MNLLVEIVEEALKHVDRHKIEHNISIHSEDDLTNGKSGFSINGSSFCEFNRCMRENIRQKDRI